MARAYLTVLVTGAAGLVGAEVTARLVADGRAVVALVHRTRGLLRNNGRRIPATEFTGLPGPGQVAVLTGDVTRPDLGLSSQQLKTLSEGVDRIVHSAAITDFGRTEDVYRSINVDGTKHVLAFAAGAGIPLVHLSTAYVCGEREGTILETELCHGQRFGNDYEHSKFLAEKMVRAASVPVAVVRPGIIVGAERSGVVRDFKNIYSVLKLATQGKIRSIPGNYQATVHLVSVDHVADLVTRVTGRFDEAAGTTLHAVGHRPLYLRDFSDVLAEYPSFHVPRFVPPSAFSAEEFTALERLYHERITTLYEAYFRREQTFDTTTAAEFARRKPAIPGRLYLRRLLDYCLKVGYLGTPRHRDIEVAAGP